jgi:hypothetical protein
MPSRGSLIAKALINDSVCTTSLPLSATIHCCNHKGVPSRNTTIFLRSSPLVASARPPSRKTETSTLTITVTHIFRVMVLYSFAAIVESQKCG